MVRPTVEQVLSVASVEVVVAVVASKLIVAFAAAERWFAQEIWLDHLVGVGAVDGDTCSGAVCRQEARRSDRR